MSEKSEARKKKFGKKSSAAATDIVTSNTVDEARSRKSIKRLVLWLVGLVIVVALACWGFAVSRKDTPKTPTNQSPAIKIDKSLPYNKLAEQYSNAGDYKAAEQTLANKLASTNDTVTKANTYGQQATIALNMNHLSDAINYARQADKASPSASTALLLGQISEASGNKSDAKRYYQLAISRLDKSGPNYDIILSNYQRQLDRVN